jgi:hypothetical protein
MTDPRFTDPRYNDPRLSDPVLRRDESAAGGMWGWIAGVAVLLLIGFLIIAGNTGNNKQHAHGAEHDRLRLDFAKAGDAGGPDGSSPGPVAGRREINSIQLTTIAPAPLPAPEQRFAGVSREQRRAGDAKRKELPQDRRDAEAERRTDNGFDRLELNSRQFMADIRK